MNAVDSKSMSVMLVLAALAMIFFATAAQAQTPAEDQYGSPTGDPPGESTPGDSGDPSTPVDTGDPGDPGDESSGGGDVLGGVLPATGGAPVYLLLAGAILFGTGATLWLHSRRE